MLLYLLFSNTIHFALMVTAAAVFFAAGLLYLGSYKVQTKSKGTLLMRSIGFFLVCFVYASYATSFSNDVFILVAQILKIVGLSLILISLTNEPVLHSLKKTTFLSTFVLPLTASAVTFSLGPFSAILFLLIGLVYLRKSTEGMEKQMKPPSLAFLSLAMSEFIKISFTWANTANVFWSKILTQFGIIWNIADVLTLAGIVILGIWVWGYIRFRLQTQIFVITFSLSIFTFLGMTIFFTYLLLNNLKQDALSHLKTDVNVIQYAIDGLKSETLAHAQAVAQDGRVKQAFFSNDKAALYTLTENYMREQKINSLVVATSSGDVLVRTENAGLTNDNVSTLPIVQVAFTGQSLSTVDSTEGITAPEISISAAVPITQENNPSASPAGVVVAKVDVNNTFVDGIKSATGFDVSIFKDNKRSATTFVAQDGKSRFTGSLETNKAILDTVLKNGQTYIGDSSIFNQSFYVAYSPLKNYRGEIIGMLFTGKPQDTLTSAAQKSINLTFLGSTILMILSLIPAYFASRYIKENIKA